MEIEQLRYPTGRFKISGDFDAGMRYEMIANIKSFPQRLTTVVMELNDDQLDTPYRAEGWTIRQVVHHVADSHLNSYIRFRWAMTEDTPVIKAYDEKAWAELPDAKSAPIKFSLNLLKSTHARWTLLMERMTSEDFAKELSHPEWENNLSLNDMLQLYNWHCNHHLAHITSLMERQNWV